jgi:hypothetical protein
MEQAMAGGLQAGATVFWGNAGHFQAKDENRKYPRAATVQKCRETGPRWRSLDMKKQRQRASFIRIHEAIESRRL